MSHSDNKCCCNCKNQIIINKHPWNQVIGKGSILDTLGYGCLAPGFIDNDKQIAIFFEDNHGMCELYTKI